jgi:hypothetical protein
MNADERRKAHIKEVIAVKTLIMGLWHLIRYTIATCVCTVVSGLLPVLAASMPIFVAAAWVLMWVLMSAIHLLGGESMVQDVPIGDPIGIVFVPLLLGSIGAFAVSAILIVVTAFNVLIILPVSLATELVCRRLSIRGVVPRLGSFLLSGSLLGIALATIVMTLFGSYHPDVPANILLVSGLVILVICDCVVFVFGFVLIMLSTLKSVVIRLKARWRQKRASTTPTEIQLHPATAADCVHF